MRRHMIRGQAFACCAMALAMLLALDVSGAELPPEIQVDRLLVQAERETGDGEHWSAVATLERVLDVHDEHGLEIPTEFWFRQAAVFQSAGVHERAVEASTRYLREAGREGQHYRAVLEILDAAEVDLAEARRAQARARVAAERAEREARARAAAIAASVPEMVEIPAGAFRMGCVTRGRCDGDEKPVREVRVGAFALSKRELTFAQWDVCTEYGTCRWVGDAGWGRDDRPVVNVSWDDAQAYVAWLSRETGETSRLPSEAEWEYAARGGAETRYSWGNDLGRGQANCDGCRSRWDDTKTAPVGSFPPNGFGLHDVHGNAYEWVQDCWNDSYDGAPSTGAVWSRGDCSRRVVRGGSWGSTARSVRVSYRGVLTAGKSNRASGFRVARTPAP